MLYGNGAELRTGQNGRNQLAYRDVLSGNRIALAHTYGYDRNRRITRIDDGARSSRTRVFGYDDLGRLTLANGEWGSGAFSYDALGNITRRQLGGRIVDIDYGDSSNRVTGVRDNADGPDYRGYSYDARGNVTGNGLLGFGYDASNQPVSMAGEVSGQYLYDGNYKRVKQTIDDGSGPETIYTMYGASGAILLRDNASTGEQTSYIRMGGTTVARLKTGGADGPETAYLHADHLGSPVAATDQSGAILWAEQFSPYGESIPGPAANPDDEGFTGHIPDTATGLTYMQARYYDPVIGRFLSNDPVGFAEGGVAYFNRYAYTANDPVNMIDPDGRQTEDLDEQNAAATAANAATAVAAREGIGSAATRNTYTNTVSGLDATDSAGRTAAKVTARANTPPITRSAIEAARPGTGAPSGSGGTANSTNAGANRLAGTLGTVGKANVAANVAINGGRILTSDNPIQETAVVGGGIGGALGGAQFGAAGGTAVGGPFGGIVGGIVGGIAGGFAGEAAVRNVLSSGGPPCTTCGGHRNENGGGSHR